MEERAAQPRTKQPPPRSLGMALGTTVAVLVFIFGATALLVWTESGQAFDVYLQTFLYNYEAGAGNPLFRESREAAYGFVDIFAVIRYMNLQTAIFIVMMFLFPFPIGFLGLYLDWKKEVKDGATRTFKCRALHGKWVCEKECVY